MTKVYIVGDHGPEHNSVRSIHKTYKGALKAWNKIRLYLLREAKSSLERDTTMREMYAKMVKNLSCKDPNTIDNGAQETPYINERTLEE